MKDDAERSSSFGDVEEDLLDRVLALARGALVELAEHDENIGPGGLIAGCLRAAGRYSVRARTGGGIRPWN